MAAIDEPTRVAPARVRHPGRTAVKWITTTDHKIIGHLYFITSFVFFMLGGIMALIIRAELWEPGLQIVDNPDQYNQLFTMHGTIMLLLFATPLFAGFANALMPLQIGAPDVAFPRLNMLAYWFYLFGGIIASAGFLTPHGAAAFGWFAYAPLSDTVYSPGLGGDLWVFGLALSGFGTILGAVNFITTILCMRAPGMTMFRMPIFTWTVMVTSILVLLVFPVLAAALFSLGADRRFGAHVFDPENGGPMLWQHVFWFFGHPEVYIIALPFFGIISEVIPVFSRKPIFGYKTLVYATIAIAALSMTVWAHHMYATGQVLLPFFAVMTMLIAVPTGVKFFNWIGTMWGGKISMDTPMLWAVGFLVTFLFGGLTGVILASPALDFHLSDSYFVVAHFHYVVFGTVVFAMFAGYYFWWPKLTGRMLDERLGKIHFWMLFIGFHTTFLIQHVLGVWGMPRRYADYLPEDGFTFLNQISSVGAFLLGASVLPFMYNVWKTWRTAPLVTVNDPWGYGNSLEWATSCPPPRHNFDSLPRIRSERPAFDLAHGTEVPIGAPAADPGVLEEVRGREALMKLESRLFVVLGTYFGILALVYGFWSRWREPVGPVGLVLATLLAFMIAFYTWFTGKRMGLRPDDDDDATIDQFQGDYGFFSPYSWWPLFLGFSAALCFLGLAVGWWLFIIGASIGVVGLVGWTFEYFKGEHAL